jgi:hypothetical protein
MALRSRIVHGAKTGIVESVRHMNALPEGSSIPTLAFLKWTVETGALIGVEIVKALTPLVVFLVSAGISLFIASGPITLIWTIGGYHLRLGTKIGLTILMLCICLPVAFWVFAFLFSISAVSIITINAIFKVSKEKDEMEEVPGLG